jgi:enamine deaminase RidA (YjgF/YER057c/UK114 family)
MDREVIVPDSMRRIAAEKGYAPGLRAGRTLYVAGQVGRTPELTVIRDPEAQFTACFENLRQVLTAAGCGLVDIVDMTTFHVDMAAHWQVFRAVKNRMLPRAAFPLTAIGVVALAEPGLLLEVKAVAVIPGSPP